MANKTTPAPSGGNATANLTLAPTTATPVIFNTTTRPWSPVYPNSCNYYVKNGTVVFDFSNQYGGIPQNIIFNLIGWFLLVLAFAILRRSAGNYGRLALVRKDDDESKWTQLFFAPDEISPEDDEDEEDRRRLEDSIANGNHDSLTSVDYNEVDSNGVCSWVASIFTLSDDKFRRRCGFDAVQYLKFQRHLIIFVLIMTVVCVGIILPVNFQGMIQGSKQDFGHTTISNLQGSDERLWIHVVIVIVFFPLGIFIMRKFSVNLRMEEYKDDECPSSRTLMIVGIPDTYCDKEHIQRHFREAYPSFEIDDVQIAYDVSKLESLDRRRELARRARYSNKL